MNQRSRPITWGEALLWLNDRRGKIVHVAITTGTHDDQVRVVQTGGPLQHISQRFEALADDEDPGLVRRRVHVGRLHLPRQVADLARGTRGRGRLRVELATPEASSSGGGAWLQVTDTDWAFGEGVHQQQP